MAYIEAGEGRVAGGGSSSRSRTGAFVVLRARKEMRAHGGMKKGKKHVLFNLFNLVNIVIFRFYILK